MSPTVSIIIPFYQENRGILSRAVQSVLLQRDCPDFEIIIVDDGSPVSARDELREFGDARIRILDQNNLGPATARNTALANVSTGTRYAAFLDSDDVWTDNHLRRAAKVLETGYDFYFSNILHLGQTEGVFFRDGRLITDHHERLYDSEPIFAYNGDMLDQIIRANVIGLPTVVYKIEKFKELRFREDLRIVGEDYWLWLQIASRRPAFAFSTECECKCGPGVNIYSGAKWGTIRSIIRAHEEIRFWKSVCQEFNLSTGQLEHMDQKISRLREEFLRCILHRIRSCSSIPIRTTILHMMEDPKTFLRIGTVLSSILRRASL